MLVWIRCSPFLMEILFIFVTPCFPRADAISSSVANANSLLLIILLEVLSFSCGYALHLVVRNVFIFNMFSICLRLFTSTSKLPFLVFLTVFGLALVGITFSIRKGENLARQTPSKDSITMNRGKSAASFSESDSERFRLDFLFEDAIYAEYFSLALRSTTHHGVQLVLGMNQGVTHSPWLRRGIRDQYTRVGFRAVANFKFSALVKFLFSTQLTLSHRPLAINR